MTHSNIKHAEKLFGEALCISHALGKFHVNVAFAGLSETLDVSIYDEDSVLLKIYNFKFNDPNIEYKMSLCMAEIDAMAVEETK